MQILKDAMVLLGALLLIASVRVSRIEPVKFDFVPAAHAASAEPIASASAEPAASPAEPIEIVLPTALPALNAQANLETLTVEPRVLRSCETKVFRFTTDSAKRDVLAIAIETPKPKATPRACKIG